MYIEKSYNSPLLSILLLMALFSSMSIPSAAQSYPQQYFSYPLPIPISLAANFGELRTNHYHMGLDLRTQQRENIAVNAPADGFISRVYISHTGYGNMLMIQHPNGYTTLYGHLNKFFPALQQFVEQKQYRDNSWAQDFRLASHHFPVKKGQFIAWSGNTGGSQGPHVHFEIRDTKTGNGLNPLLFGLGISDNIAPLVYNVYYYDRDKRGIYSSNPVSIPLKGRSGNISGGLQKVSVPQISFGFSAEDKISTSSFKFGVYKTTLFVDEEEFLSITMNNIPMEKQRYLNAGIDYKKKLLGGPYIEHLSKLPGNQLDIYTGNTDGIIDLSDGKARQIKIVFADTKNNKTTVRFSVQYDGSIKRAPASKAPNVAPRKPGSLQTASAEFIYSQNAFYDYVDFTMNETSNTKYNNQVSPTIQLGHYYIPIHDEYSIAIKCNDISDKNNVVMQLRSGTYKALYKGLWDGNKMIGHFNRLGEVCLIKDEIPPTISLGNLKEGMVVKNGSILSVSAADNLGNIQQFEGTANGQWLLFVRKGNRFSYTVDERLPEGKSTLQLFVEDIAGNKTVKTLTIIKK